MPENQSFFFGLPGVILEELRGFNAKMPGQALNIAIRQLGSSFSAAVCAFRTIDLLLDLLSNHSQPTVARVAGLQEFAEPMVLVKFLLA